MLRYYRIFRFNRLESLQGKRFGPVGENYISRGHRPNLFDARVIWWRRPNPISLHPELSPGENLSFTYGECHAALTGLWACLDAHWINDPIKDEIASRKAFQLKLASELSMRIPRTLITNNPDQARAFIEQEGFSGTVYKAFQATEKAWRETRLLKTEELEMIDAVRYAPVIFQEYIRADIDLRITVIGDDIFPTEIRSGEAQYRIDYRMNLQSASVQPHILPDAVEKQLRRYMQALGLVYGAIDMRLTPEGEYVFLEINPAGQWQFMAERTGIPISDTMANYLLHKSKK